MEINGQTVLYIVVGLILLFAVVQIVFQGTADNPNQKQAGSGYSSQGNANEETSQEIGPLPEMVGGC